MGSEICWMSAVDMAAAVREKKLSPVETTGAVIRRIEEVNGKVNAVCTLAADTAIAAARQAEKEITAGTAPGPLCGVPVTIKDLNYTAGIKTTFGSKLYENYIPDQDDVLVTRLKRAGAIVVGKTNTPEFGLIGMTDNNVFGPSFNPWKLDRTPGGSSGGAGAAAAAGFGPIHQGSDGGGSIRIPSSFCGVYGIKPHFGRVPHHPRKYGFETLSTMGPITRTVADAALMLQVMAGPYPWDRQSLPRQDIDFTSAPGKEIKGLRMAWTPDLGYAPVDPEVKSICTAAARKFEAAGCKVEEINPDLISTDFEWLIMVLTETAAANEERREEWEAVMYRHYRPFIPMADGFKATDIAKALFKRHELGVRVARIFEQYDVLLTPTMPVTAFKAGELGPAQIDGKDAPPTAMASFTIPFNMTGQPAASVPCGFTAEGLPVGLQIVGRPYDELTVLAVSAAFERISPWIDRRPEI
ncbi:MAG: amidase [Bacillota bacterium]